MSDQNSTSGKYRAVMLDKGGTSIVTLVLVCSFCIGATAKILTWVDDWDDKQTAMQTQINQLVKQVGNNHAALSDRINFVDKKIVGKSPEGWHRSEMSQWCERTERQNTDWKCGPIYPDGGF